MPTETPAAPAEPDAGKAPFDGEFDADRAARLIATLRADLAASKAATATERQARTDREAAEMTDLDKARTAADAAVKRATAAERTLFVERAVRAHDLPDEVIEFLTGDTEEEITAKAERLATLGKPKTAEPTAEEAAAAAAAATSPVTRPVPALTPGHGGEAPSPFDPAAIAEATRTRDY